MRRVAKRVRLPIFLVLACCAGASVGTAQQLDVCAEARGCLNQVPQIASVPRMTGNSSGYGLAKPDATSTEKPSDLASKGNEEPATGLSTGQSWRRWPSLTDF